MKQTFLRNIHIMSGAGALALVLVGLAIGTLSGQTGATSRLIAPVETQTSEYASALISERENHPQTESRTSNETEESGDKQKKPATRVAGAQQTITPEAESKSVVAAAPPTPTPDARMLSLNFVNGKRKIYGLSPLSIDSVLNSYALRQAQQMAESCQLSHQNLSNILGTRDARGKRLMAVAENVAFHSSQLDAALQNLWNSEGHRDNMLGDYNRVGIAVVRSANPSCSGFVYTAQVFGRS